MASSMKCGIEILKTNEEAMNRVLENVKRMNEKEFIVAICQCEENNTHAMGERCIECGFYASNKPRTVSKEEYETITKPKKETGMKFVNEAKLDKILKDNNDKPNLGMDWYSFNEGLPEAKDEGKFAVELTACMLKRGWICDRVLERYPGIYVFSPLHAPEID